MKTETKVVREIRKLIDNNENYWDFKGNSERGHVHKLIRYPATMVPVMQSKLIDLFIENDSSIEVLLDPFMGSGTTIVEANAKGLDAIGIDINPFAYLITKVKVTNIDISLLILKVEKLIERVSLEEHVNYSYWFVKISKWFKPEVIKTLTYIRECILQEKDIDYRCVMWVAFSKTIQYSSNDRASTFKLHAKSKADMEKAHVDVVYYFVKVLKETIGLFEEYYREVHNNRSENVLFCGNSIDILKKNIQSETIDIVSTSPPYGDNATTVTYGQYSMLQLRWIPISDLQTDISTKLLDNYSSIDRQSIGGTNYTIDEIHKSNILLRSKSLKILYNKLICSDESKARKVISFYIDYEKVLTELFRVVKNNKYLIFTVGNRKVDGEIVYLDKVTIELSEKMGGNCIYQFERNILNKRMPDKVSKLKNNKSVSSMKKETILIFVKVVNNRLKE